MEHFDKRAQNWDNDLMKVERANTFAKEIFNIIQPNKSMNALEFGCGTGLLSHQLKDDFKTITLIDTSEEMIKVLNEKIISNNIKNFNPIHINLLNDDLDKKDFNVIYTLMTLHHIIDLNKILKIFHSLLNTNGYLCIADLVKEDGSFHYQTPDFDGHNGFDKKELISILINNGFEILNYNISFEIEKIQDNRIYKYPLFLMVCKKI